MAVTRKKILVCTGKLPIVLVPAKEWRLYGSYLSSHKFLMFALVLVEAKTAVPGTCKCGHKCKWALRQASSDFISFQSGIFGLYNSNSNNWGCSPKSPLFEYKTDIILRNRHCHRFITFTVVYFTFCFRKKIFFQSSTIQYRFFLETFFTFFWFFSKSTPNISPSVDLVA